ncbi:CGNR zinc finger domain-containing protein [Actinomadura scrupuli]|uniref:CGNR zinc finger domain-containing protein n=1 Tax=Actinomadura scrupuli TaxID=559629 RepID=UPI003D96C180
MIFTHDIEHALGAVVDLINTAPAAGEAEHLPDLAALRAYVERNRISDVPELTSADLAAVRRLRAAFHDVFAADELTATVSLINRIVGATRTSPHLTDHDGHDWHIHFFGPGARIAEHLAAECGMALAFVVSAGELDRLRTCEAPDCARVLVDLSRNRCRRYCDSRTCGNRMHVAAYRARQREALA